MHVKRSFYTTISHEIDIERVEDVACNLCRDTRYTSIGAELGYDIRECLNCSLVYVSPQPAAEEIPKLYQNMYADAPRNREHRPPPGLVENHLRRLILKRLPRGGRLFETGCGRGRFLETMAEDNFELNAVELDPSAAADARTRVPSASIRCGTLDDTDIERETQDCVVAIAVLEHMKDPRETLTKMSALLREGGVLVLQVPRVAPFLKLKKWIPNLPIFFEAPRHLFDFSPKTLETYLHELGYIDCRVEVARPYASNGPIGLALIWAVKLPGLVLHALSGGRYIYPYAAAFVVHALKGANKPTDQPT